MQSIKVKRIKSNAVLPKRATDGAAGADLYACIDQPVTIESGDLVMIPTGIAIELPTKEMAGFVFASVKLIKENVELEGGGEAVEREAAKATGVAEATTVEVVDGAAIDPSVSFVQSTQFENNQKGEAQMSKAKAAAAALSAAFVAAPFAAANGDEYQFIISGDPVAAATAGSSYDYSDTASLTVGRLTNGIVCDSEFEARSRTTDESDTGPLRSDEFKGMVILIK